jgi:hypothetical protein
MNLNEHRTIDERVLDALVDEGTTRDVAHALYGEESGDRMVLTQTTLRAMEARGLIECRGIYWRRVARKAS